MVVLNMLDWSGVYRIIINYKSWRIESLDIY